MGTGRKERTPVCTCQCAPHTDRYKPQSRSFKTVKYHPLPESSLRKFGEWIVTEGWDKMKDNLSPTQQAEAFEIIVKDKLDIFCPEKSVRLSSQDKPWMNNELKIIHRQKSREYIKRGKSMKYLTLAEKFESKHKCEAEKYLRQAGAELCQAQAKLC